MRDPPPGRLRFGASGVSERGRRGDRERRDKLSSCVLLLGLRERPRRENTDGWVGSRLRTWCLSWTRLRLGFEWSVSSFVLSVSSGLPFWRDVGPGEFEVWFLSELSWELGADPLGPGDVIVFENLSVVLGEW